MQVRQAEENRGMLEDNYGGVGLMKEDPRIAMCNERKGLTKRSLANRF